MLCLPIYALHIAYSSRNHHYDPFHDIDSTLRLHHHPSNEEWPYFVHELLMSFDEIFLTFR